MLEVQGHSRKGRVEHYRCYQTLELVHIDYLTIEAPKRDKDVNIIVVATAM